MPIKTVCFECCEHSTFDKQGNCYHCHTDNIVTVGSALRLPKKINVNAWKKLREIYMLQKSAYIARNEKMTIMIGFPNHNFRHRASSKTGMPQKVKDAVVLENLKKHFSRRAT